MSRQRRRGERVEIFKTVEETDRRGNRVRRPSLEDPHIVRAALIPDRSARAEVPGQMGINVFNMITTADLSSVDLFSRIRWRGAWWDPVSPPALHIGTRHVQHWTILVRERQDAGGM